MKNEPSLRVSGSAGSSTIPLRLRMAITASRTRVQIVERDASLVDVLPQLGIAHRRAAAARQTERHGENDVAIPLAGS